MTIMERVLRTLRAWNWEREMRKIERRLDRQFPQRAEQKKKLAKARKGHRASRDIQKRLTVETLAALRGEHHA